MLSDDALNRAGFKIMNLHGAELAATFQDAEHSGLARTASPKMLALVAVLVLLLATQDRFVGLNLAL